MNKHLTKYLTHPDILLREWVKSRIYLTDQKYFVINYNINYIPDENTFVSGKINIYEGNGEIKQKIIYCTTLFCGSLDLPSLPELPVCRKLCCWKNALTYLPELPVVEQLSCSYNVLIELPKLPNCELLYCCYNNLTKLPDLLKCRILDCYGNPIRSLPKLPKDCEVTINEE